MQTKRPDTELINEVLGGNTSAYAEIVDRHKRFVFTLAMRFAKNREDAEEIAQDCFVKAYRSLHTFRHNSKFSTWLYSIVYTTAMTFIRRKKPDTFSLDDEEKNFSLSDLQGSFQADTVEQKSRRQYITKAIDMLTPDDAVIISLYYLAENSLEEIGKALGMETNTAKVKLHRARHRLREKLERLLKHEVKELL
jgi:RNA polymerase sigma-70 factor (ECF subfamily)